MKLSTRSRYGLRFLIYIGLHYPQRLISLKEVSQNENISEKYLEQIVPILRSNGLIETQRGPKGGYSLGCAPKQITVEKVVDILEGGLHPVDCLLDTSSCDHQSECVTFDVWQGLEQTIRQYLKSITLAELVARKQLKSSHAMYHI